jgi:mannose-1-phosphate guanylyltransferase
LEVAAAGDGPQALSSFVEKPWTGTTAEQYLAATLLLELGHVLFHCRCDGGKPWQPMPAMFGRHLKPCLLWPKRRRAVTRFAEAPFIAQPDISIDYAVMERADKIAMVPCRFRLV